jgi:hypothetical protein
VSAVADHTLIGDHLDGGAFLAAAVRVYLDRRHMLAVPAASVVAAMGGRSMNGPAAGRLAWLLSPELGAVVKLAELGLVDVAEIGMLVPSKRSPDAGDYLLHAPPALLARRLGMPVLTRDEGPYRRWSVPTKAIP